MHVIVSGKNSTDAEIQNLDGSNTSSRLILGGTTSPEEHISSSIVVVEDYDSGCQFLGQNMMKRPPQASHLYKAKKKSLQNHRNVDDYKIRGLRFKEDLSIYLSIYLSSNISIDIYVACDVVIIDEGFETAFPGWQDDA